MRYLLVLATLMIASCATTTIIPPPRDFPGVLSVYGAPDTIEQKASSVGSEYLPVTKVQPQYPRYALQKGLEGWVIVEFTVNKEGTPINVEVVDSSPKNIFDDSAIDAAKKFRYTPRYVDGKPVETHGVQNAISFMLGG
jgi:TonB family protein